MTQALDDAAQRVSRYLACPTRHYGAF
jgi:hypothetical protein